jgi:ABC-type glycerol-3-phosphate transport system permease component
MAVASKSIPQVRQRARSGGQVGRIVRSIVMIGGLGFFSAWTLFPLIWIVTTSFKSSKEIYSQTAGILPTTFTWQHYDTICWSRR